MSFKTIFTYTSLIFSLVLIPVSFAQSDKAAIKIANIDADITIDAKIDEQEWQHATKVSLNIVTRPTDNTPSPIETTARLLESDGVFYLSFVAQDPNPKAIRAYLKDRDKAWGEDLVGIKIDTYNDQRSAYRFLVNPLGVQIDGVENEVTKKESDSWDGIWNSAGRITENGYVVEMALPLRMLNFKEADMQTWGIELVRYYPRDEFMRISNIRLERDNNCEICQLAKAEGFKNAKQGNNLIVAPAIVAGRIEERNEDTDKWHEEDNTDVSLDVRWGITPDVLLNATINPDFSTVETDSAQLNINNTFALFFDEKRPFFLDNADYFESNYNLIYTRNISAPNYGAKLTGRHNDHSFGLFYTDDKSTHILVPGNRTSTVGEIDDESQDSALRYRYNYNPDITLGWTSTLRTAEDYSNQVHGVDARFKLNTFDVFKFQYLYSDTEYPDEFFQQFCNGDESDACDLNTENVHCDLNGCDYNESVLRTRKEAPFSGNAFRMSYRHSDDEWFYRLGYNHQNEGFRGDLGFISRVDSIHYAGDVNRRWYAEANQWWTQFRVFGEWDKRQNDDHEFIDESFEIGAQFNAIYDSFVKLTLSTRDRVGSRIDKSSLAIDGNTTRFTEEQVKLYAKSKPWGNVNISNFIKLGDAVDFSNNRLGKIKQVTPTLNWNVNQHWEIKLKQTFSQLDADGRNVYIARLTDLRTTYQFNVQSFLRFSLIYNNTTRNPNNYPYSDSDDISKHSKNVSTELLYAYKINPQTVFYLGYSDHHDGEENLSDIEQNERTVFMKYSYAWIH